MKRRGLVIIFSIWALTIGSDSVGSILNSVHNLSPSGPGQVHATEDSGVCEFCHTSHSASPAAALWNRNEPGTTYTPYSSSTALALPGQPTGASLLCLSCHDGTIALGDVLNRTSPISMTGGTQTMPTGRNRTGTNLRHHHPISFLYDSRLAARKGELAMPSSLPREIVLDRAGQMQCTSCHDPHDDSFGKFLVMSNQNSRLCRECHRKSGWSNNSHSHSNKSWNGQGRNPWPNSKERTVAGNACRNCHETHQNSGGDMLLLYASEVEICTACHDGSVADQDTMASFRQFSAHPVTNTARNHDPAENVVISDRHVTCSDCHDPHESPVGRKTEGEPRQAPKVRGVTLNNSEQKEAFRGYQVCLRCHGDSPGKRVPRVRRQLDQNNIRAEIQPGNPSFHPIAAPGRNRDVPSLISPWNEQSTIDCVDCHGSSSASSNEESRAPHGSRFEPILVRNYETTDNTPESPSNYSLCYHCHSRNSILNNESFLYHDKHIRDNRTPCSVCHDSHGISATQGNSMNNSHLMNFDTTIVRPNTAGLLRFVDQGRFSGSCDLMCHDRNHANESY